MASREYFKPLIVADHEIGMAAVKFFATLGIEPEVVSENTLSSNGADRILPERGSQFSVVMIHAEFSPQGNIVGRSNIDCALGFVRQCVDMDVPFVLVGYRSFLGTTDLIVIDDLSSLSLPGATITNLAKLAHRSYIGTFQDLMKDPDCWERFFEILNDGRFFPEGIFEKRRQSRMKYRKVRDREWARSSAMMLR